jgi:hypothetical protein
MHGFVLTFALVWKGADLDGKCAHTLKVLCGCVGGCAASPLSGELNVYCVLHMGVGEGWPVCVAAWEGCVCSMETSCPIALSVWM